APCRRCAAENRLPLSSQERQPARPPQPEGYEPPEAVSSLLERRSLRNWLCAHRHWRGQILEGHVPHVHVSQVGALYEEFGETQEEVAPALHGQRKCNRRPG